MGKKRKGTPKKKADDKAQVVSRKSDSPARPGLRQRGGKGGIKTTYSYGGLNTIGRKAVAVLEQYAPSDTAPATESPATEADAEAAMTESGTDVAPGAKEKICGREAQLDKLLSNATITVEDRIESNITAMSPKKPAAPSPVEQAQKIEEAARVTLTTVKDSSEAIEDQISRLRDANISLDKAFTLRRKCIKDADKQAIPTHVLRGELCEKLAELHMEQATQQEQTKDKYIDSLHNVYRKAAAAIENLSQEGAQVADARIFQLRLLAAEARILLAEKNPSESMKWLGEAAEQCNPIIQKHRISKLWQARAYETLGHVQMAQREFETAVKTFQQAMTAFNDIKLDSIYTEDKQQADAKKCLELARDAAAKLVELVGTEPMVTPQHSIDDGDEGFSSTTSGEEAMDDSKQDEKSLVAAEEAESARKAEEEAEAARKAEEEAEAARKAEEEAEAARKAEEEAEAARKAEEAAEAARKAEEAAEAARKAEEEAEAERKAEEEAEAEREAEEEAEAARIAEEAEAARKAEEEAEAARKAEEEAEAARKAEEEAEAARKAEEEAEAAHKAEEAAEAARKAEEEAEAERKAEEEAEAARKAEEEAEAARKAEEEAEAERKAEEEAEAARKAEEEAEAARKAEEEAEADTARKAEEEAEAEAARKAEDDQSLTGTEPGSANEDDADGFGDDADAAEFPGGDDDDGPLIASKDVAELNQEQQARAAEGPDVGDDVRERIGIGTAASKKDNRGDDSATATAHDAAAEGAPPLQSIGRHRSRRVPQSAGGHPVEAKLKDQRDSGGSMGAIHTHLMGAIHTHLSSSATDGNGSGSDTAPQHLRPSSPPVPPPLSEEAAHHRDGSGGDLELTVQEGATSSESGSRDAHPSQAFLNLLAPAKGAFKMSEWHQQLINNSEDRVTHFENGLIFCNKEYAEKRGGSYTPRSFGILSVIGKGYDKQSMFLGFKAEPSNAYYPYNVWDLLAWQCQLAKDQTPSQSYFEMLISEGALPHYARLGSTTVTGDVVKRINDFADGCDSSRFYKAYWQRVAAPLRIIATEAKRCLQNRGGDELTESQFDYASLHRIQQALLMLCYNTRNTPQPADDAEEAAVKAYTADRPNLADSTGFRAMRNLMHDIDAALKAAEKAYEQTPRPTATATATR